VLWCYKKDLELSSNKKKRLTAIKKLEAKGNLDKEEIN
jgi:N-acetyltransferase 10